MVDLRKQQKIVDFWFGELFTDGLAKKKISDRWFKKDSSFDKLVSENFEKDVEMAKRGEYDEWKETSLGSLALILLCDQFTRNIYRDTKEMFSCDKIAQMVAQEVIEKGFDRELPIAKRQFIYMPFMHTENKELQRKSVELFQRLQVEVVDHIKEYVSVKYAKAHQEIILKFSRFPNRNETLGRISTSDETEFLKGPDSSF